MTAQLPRALGYLLGLIGLVYIAHGVGYDSSYSAIPAHSLLDTTTYGLVVLVVVIWAMWLAHRVAAGPLRRAIVWRSPRPGSA